MFPPLPQLFADVAWRRMAASSKKTGGEGRGEGDALKRFHPRMFPLIRPVGHLLPRGGEGILCHTANSFLSTSFYQICSVTVFRLKILPFSEVPPEVFPKLLARDDLFQSRFRIRPTAYDEA